MSIINSDTKARMINEAAMLRERANQIAAKVRRRDGGVPTSIEIHAVFDLIKQAYQLEKRASR